MKLILPLLLLYLSSHSQDTGRIRQSTTLVIEYKLVGNTYDIYLRNAHKDTSIIEVQFNDSTYFLRLGNWEKVHFKRQGEFSLWARNVSHKGQPEDWMECGSKRLIDEVKITLTKGTVIRTGCFVIPNYMRQ